MTGKGLGSERTIDGIKSESIGLPGKVFKEDSQLLLDNTPIPSITLGKKVSKHKRRNTMNE